jgi:hypothetical protein
MINESTPALTSSPVSPVATPAEMHAQIAASQGNLGQQSGGVPKIMPSFWTEHDKNVAPSEIERFN